MGLDMYVVERNKKDNQEDYEFAYFRKFNALHNYFETEHNAGNLDETPITLEMAQLLKDKADVILARPNTPDVAEAILPAGYGPFFGSDQYDDYYYSCVRDMQRMSLKLINILSEPNNQREFYYHAWY